MFFLLVLKYNFPFIFLEINLFIENKISVISGIIWWELGTPSVAGP